MDQVDLLLVELQADVAKENAMNLDMMSNLLTMKDQVSSKRVDKGGLRDLKPMGAYRRTEERIIPKEVRTCYVCKDDIEEGGIKFKNEYYHDHHFTCSVCQMIMRNLKVFHVENNLLCENDYHKKYSNWCEYCKDIIKGDGIEACNKHFCSDHFFCSQCGTDLSNVQYFEYKGKAFCANDYGNFAERCTHCNLPLLDSYVTCADKLYHSKCLVCSVSNINRQKGADRSSILIPCMSMMVNLIANFISIQKWMVYAFTAMRL